MGGVGYTIRCLLLVDTIPLDRGFIFSILVDFVLFFFFHIFRIRNCLSQLYAKDITPDDKQELDEALQREVSRCQCYAFLSFLFQVF